MPGRPLVSGARDGVGQVAVIPALAEYAHLFATLDSLCRNPAEERARTLVICVVNNRKPPAATSEEIADNGRTLRQLDALMRKGGPLRLGYIDASSPGVELPGKSGVGLARKLGLDWGAAVLAQNGHPNGALLSLDADTLAEPNYLQTVRKHFLRPGAWAGVIDYAHRIEGPEHARAAILSYELFLRYHVLGLQYAGSPYAFPTIGSTMCCTAQAYAAVSGMNRRQAGEDFYFLQQLAKTGPVEHISGTTVHPSGRASGRVPFGTGRRVLDYETEPESAYLTYHPAGYRILQDWLRTVEENVDRTGDELLGAARGIAPELADFLPAQGFPAAWDRLRGNSRDNGQLLSQFHCWFDAFRTMKLLHHLRDNGHPRQDLFASIWTMLGWCGGVYPAPPGAAAHVRHDLDYQQALLDALRHPPVMENSRSSRLLPS